VTEWTYETSPVAWAYKEDRSFASFILGPVGSGKSVPSMQRVFDIANHQEASPDGMKRSRFAIIRNTLPELRSTTAVTYGQIYPDQEFGEIIWRSPATHMLKPRGTGIECEVNFIALDKPKDVKKLLSLELTGAFINESREVARTVITRMTERVGRFGVNERPSTWSGIWGDSNPPDTDHYLYDWHYGTTPQGYSFHKQPPGVLEVMPYKNGAEIIDENFPEYQGIKLSSAVVLIWYRGSYQRVECPIEIMEALDRYWIVNPWMENMAALSKVSSGRNPLGARSYYGRALGGKTLEEIRSYLQGVYTFVTDGKRVVPNYHPDTHGKEYLPVLEEERIYLGCDVGGGTLQPSAIFLQRHPRGLYLAHHEVVCDDMGVDRFGDLVVRTMQKLFPRHVERGLVGTGWGDPAGEGRDEIFEVKAFDHLRNEHGIDLRAAPTQDIPLRVAAINTPCGRMVDGKPGLLVNRTGCPTLHKGLSGAWHYKRLQVTGEDRYAEKPSKNDASHPCDGLSYGLLGLGEYTRLGGTNRTPQPAAADGSFDVF
jgi:hypothetical protein